jgi:hypothetical protein
MDRFVLEADRQIKKTARIQHAMHEARRFLRKESRVPHRRDVKKYSRSTLIRGFTFSCCTGRVHAGELSPYVSSNPAVWARAFPSALP